LIVTHLRPSACANASSSCRHLRASGEYKAGWFFGYTIVQIEGAAAQFTIHELKAPKGQGRVTSLGGWGMLGLK
jgi:hypothetical protein